MNSLYNKLKIYSKSEIIPFHMPGHKRNYEKFGINSVAGIDITEIDGFDDYHYPQEIIKEIQENAANIYGTTHSIYLVNGTTAGILTAISAVTSYGDKIVVARNCHKSVYNGIMLSGLCPEYIYPSECEGWGILGQISPDDVEDALKRSEAKAVVITSPTYEGVVSDVKSIANVCHKMGAVLIVDEAHGAHFNYSDEFPVTAMKCGADIVIESLHKTLPSYTQTAILHIQGSRVDVNEVRRFLSAYQTSSPSYIFMSGINECIDYMVSEEGREANRQYISNLKNLREKLCSLNNIRLFKPGVGAFDYDISKLVLYVPQKGAYLYKMLLEKYNIQSEMAARDYVIAMTSIGDEPGWYEMLYNALAGLDKEFRNDPAGEYQMIKAKPVMRPAEALKNPKQEFDLEKSCGKIAVEAIYAYPPGIPIIYPGEEITEEILDRIEKMRRSGIVIKGFANYKGDKILCIK